MLLTLHYTNERFWNGLIISNLAQATDEINCILGVFINLFRFTSKMQLVLFCQSHYFLLQEPCSDAHRLIFYCYNISISVIQCDMAWSDSSCRKMKWGNYMYIKKMGLLVASQRYGQSNVKTNAIFKSMIQQHKWIDSVPLRWRHNGLNSVSNHQPHDCVLNRLFRRRSKKTSKLGVTGLCAQRASSAENVTIWWRHHALLIRNKGKMHFWCPPLLIFENARPCHEKFVNTFNSTLNPDI